MLVVSRGRRWALFAGLLLLHLTVMAAGDLATENSMSDAEWDADDISYPNDGVPLCSSGVERTGAVVVGCGLAGLFAAAHLQREGVPTVLLEADPVQCGGRLRSRQLRFDAFPGFEISVEEAANFMYGTQKQGTLDSQNPTHRLFAGYDLQYYEYEDSFSLFEADGTPVAEETKQDELSLFMELREACLDDSSYTWFDEYIENTVDPTFEISPDEYGPTTMEQCDNWVADPPIREAIAHFYLEQEHGKRWEELGRGSWPDESTYDFDGTLFFQNDQRGSSWLINEFVDSHIQADSLYLDAAVETIRYTEGKNAKVVATLVEGGQRCRKRFRSNYVIATPTVKVLREKIDFRPPLRLDTHPMDMNVMEKVWIKFDRTFWPDEQFMLIANEQQDGHGTLWINQNNMYPGSNMLLGFVRQDMINAVGGLNRDGVTKWMSGLRNLPGWDDTIKWDFATTNWSGNPNFLGSWEWSRFGLNYKDYFENVEPRGKLHIAGAAHCNRYWGFTWAAILSGMHQGEWVAKKYNENDPNRPAPYTPCDDPDDISDEDWRQIYEKNPFFGPTVGAAPLNPTPSPLGGPNPTPGGPNPNPTPSPQTLIRENGNCFFLLSILQVLFDLLGFEVNFCS